MLAVLMNDKYGHMSTWININNNKGTSYNYYFENFDNELLDNYYY